MTYGELLADPAKLRKSHADAIGPAYQALLANPALGPVMKQSGLAVHAYTLRQEKVFLPDQVSLSGLYTELIKLGVDGVFTDNVAQVREIRTGCGQN